VGTSSPLHKHPPNTITGLAVWLVPSQGMAEKLKSIMHSHPRSSSRSYPHFYPHITLASTASSTPLNSVVSSIPGDILAIPVTFQSLKVGDNFFRSVYVSIHLSPELSALQSSIYAASSVFERKTPSFPHMSIFYIEDDEAEERTRMARGLELNGLVRTGEGCVELKFGADGEEERVHGFQGKEIWIVDCDGPVVGWDSKVLKKIVLS
jgi:2',3'-cyclic-nucleotide 3'-phosphodiesterase